MEIFPISIIYFSIIALTVRWLTLFRSEPHPKSQYELYQEIDVLGFRNLLFFVGDPNILTVRRNRNAFSIIDIAELRLAFTFYYINPHTSIRNLHDQDSWIHKGSQIPTKSFISMQGLNNLKTNGNLVHLMDANLRRTGWGYWLARAKMRKSAGMI